MNSKHRRRLQNYVCKISLAERWRNHCLVEKEQYEAAKRGPISDDEWEIREQNKRQAHEAILFLGVTALGIIAYICLAWV